MVPKWRRDSMQTEGLQVNLEVGGAAERQVQKRTSNMCKRAVRLASDDLAEEAFCGCGIAAEAEVNPDFLLSTFPDSYNRTLTLETSSSPSHLAESL